MNCVDSLFFQKTFNFMHLISSAVVRPAFMAPWVRLVRIRPSFATPRIVITSSLSLPTTFIFPRIRIAVVIITPFLIIAAIIAVVAVAVPVVLRPPFSLALAFTLWQVSNFNFQFNDFKHEKIRWAFFTSWSFVSNLCLFLLSSLCLSPPCCHQNSCRS